MTTVSLYSEVDLDDETEAITLAKSSVGFETVVGGGHVATSGVVTEEIGLFTAATYVSWNLSLSEIASLFAL